MRRLSRSIHVNAPASFALAFVRTYFLQRGPEGAARLALRFPLPDALMSGLTIEKIVLLEFASARADTHASSIAIGWKPLATRALPSFSGMLEALAAGREACRLTIEGEYAPPGGVPGALFDRLIGVHIAGATLSALLTRFTADIEADYLQRVSR